jgi:hypothetical protein
MDFTESPGMAFDDDAELFFQPSRILNGNHNFWCLRWRLVAVFGWMCAFFLTSAPLTSAQTSVLMHHYDIGRTGQNTNETILTPANVNSTTFEKLFSVPTDGLVFAQPLYVPGVAVSGQGTHNVVFVATEHDSLYAYDADTGGTPLWTVSFRINGATSVPWQTVGAGDIYPEIGITGTPVIDPSTGTLYLVAETLESGVCVHRLHAIDITSGAEKFGGPVVLQASAPGTGSGSSNGTLVFNSLVENQRPGLLLLNGNVYIGFAAHGDNGFWHGWILSYNAATLQQTAAWTASPNGLGSGFWAAGSGLAADANNGGRLFVVTGNGDYPVPGNVVPNPAPAPSSSVDYGDSIVSLSVANNQIVPTDYFTPYNTASLDAADTDMGSGGVLVLPPQTGSYPNILIQAGKQGRIYVVNRDMLTLNNSYFCNGCTSDPEILQTVNGIGGLWSMPAYWNGNVYFWGSTDHLKAYSLTNGVLSASQTSESAESSAFPGSTPVVSANGTTNGIVWAVESDGFAAHSPAILRAYDATNVSNLFYASNLTAGRDNLGPAVKFVVPIVANGKVYVGTSGELDVFGLIGSEPQAAAPAISPAAGTYGAAVNVTISDSTTGTTIYYTTDGSTPTINSAIYSKGVPISATATVNAIAAVNGYLQSPMSSATYTISTSTAAPQFSPAPGSYVGTQPVTLSDASPSPTIYYTLDGSTPTHSSAVYSGAIQLSTTTVITAIGSSAGLTDSAPVTGTYTVTPVSSATINYSQGFSNPAGMQFNGVTDLDDTRLQLTNGGLNEAGSAFYTTPVDIRNFTTDFAFQLSNAMADGTTFTIQNSAAGATALGASGGNLGYGTGTKGIGNSVAIKFDIYSNDGEGDDSTGLYVNGASPTVPSIDLTSSGIVLNNGDTIAAHITYNGTTLTMTLTDDVLNTSATESWTVNIPTTIGSNTAYVGFTGGTGGLSSSQKIETWTLESTPPAGPPAATPSITPGTETFTGSLSVALGDGTTGAAIYYTTDGSTPIAGGGGTTRLYANPFTVNATTTVNAIATASTYSTSALATATFTQQAVASPTFTPNGGAITSTQGIVLTDAVTSAAIYYTTDGSVPSPGVGTTKLYGGAFTLATSATVNAIATYTGYANSVVSSAVFTVGSLGTVATPALTPNGGKVSANQAISISDATTGASIYYTVDGSIPSPGVGTTVAYTGAFALGQNPPTTVKAIALEPGYTNSAVKSVAFTILPAAPAPSISPAAGTYTGSFSVSFSDSLSGTTYYYTTDGSSPAPGVGTTQKYTAPFTVSASETVQAIAEYNGYSRSAVTSAAYVIGSSGGITGYGSGFTTTSGLQLNGSAAWNQTANRITLTNGGASQAASVFATASVNVQSFTTTFSFQLTNAAADGFVFVLQNNSLTALGGSGGLLGYASGTNAVFSKSVAVKFDLFSNSGEGANSTGIYLNGASPIVPAVDLTPSGVNLHSGDVFNVTLNYDGAWLQMTVTDTVTNATFTDSWQVNIPSMLGATTGYAGFTASTGGGTATQEILNWMFTPGMPVMKDPTQYQTASLMASSVSSGPTYAIQPWTGYVSGTGTGLSATKVGDNVTITLNVPVAGTYDVRFASKNYTARGVTQLSVNGVNVGSPVDEFSTVPAALWYEFDLGPVTLAAGNQPFRFTVTGKDAASTAYALAFEYIKLTPQ